MRKTQADKVKEYRKQQGWSQQNLADQAGVSLRTVGRLEQGKAISVLAQMALSIVMKGAV